MADLNQIATHREDHTIVWLDPLIDPEDLHTQETVIKLSDTCKVCDDITDCQTYLKTILDPAILIISGSCAVQCLKSFHSIPSVDSIVIYCVKREKYSWINNVYKKVAACVQTEADLIEHVHRLMTIKCQTSFYTINQRENDLATFMWFHLLKELLIRLPVVTDHSKEEMIRNCQSYYRHNHAELAKIEEFKKTYDRKNAIQWYTKDSFIYRMVNKALRTENIKTLYFLRSFIYDLHHQLVDAHSSMLSDTNESNVLTLYRGARLPLSELNELRNNTGALITMNGFLSTSRSYDVAIAFAQGPIITDYTSVLFKITVDLDTPKPMCIADISEYSSFPDEQEVLFNVGCIFRVGTTQYSIGRKMWKVSLTLTAANEDLDVPQLPVLFQFGCLAQNKLNQSIFVSLLEDPFRKDCDSEIANAGFHRLLELKNLYAPLSLSYLLNDIDNCAKVPLVYKEDKGLRRVVSSDYLYDCSYYENNGNADDVSRKVDDSCKNAFSSNAKSRQSFASLYLKLLLDHNDLYTNTHANYFQRCVDNNPEKFAFQQETNRSVQYLFNYLHMSTGNTNQEFFVKNPIVCFDIRKDRLNKEKKGLSKAFSEFQTKFVTDASQIIQLALQCQVYHQQLYLVLSESVLAELKSFETKRIRIYYLNDNLRGPTRKDCDCDQLNEIYVNTIEQLTNRLYHDLAQFYSKAAEQAIYKGQHPMTAKHLLLKSAQCYELLAQSTKDIIQRYQNSLK
jgi:hypothetical protein